MVWRKRASLNSRRGPTVSLLQHASCLTPGHLTELHFFPHPHPSLHPILNQNPQEPISTFAGFLSYTWSITTTSHLTPGHLTELHFDISSHPNPHSHPGLHFHPHAPISISTSLSLAGWHNLQLFLASKFFQHFVLKVHVHTNIMVLVLTSMLILVIKDTGCFFTGPPPKKLKYGKHRLGRLGVIRTLQIHQT